MPEGNRARGVGNLQTTDSIDQQRQRAEALRQSADDAAHLVRTLYVTFLLLGTYIAIITWSTTHEQLLRESMVTLPLLNVGLPVVEFYMFIPWLFVLVHFNLVLQLYLLARKLHAADAAIAGLPAGDQADQRERLFSFPFSHMLIGRHHGPTARRMLALMVWITVIGLPLLLLLGMQLRFLPYHSVWITWLQRGAVLADLAVLWMFWPRIIASGGRVGAWWSKLAPRPVRILIAGRPRRSAKARPSSFGERLERRLALRRTQAPRARSQRSLVVVTMFACLLSVDALTVVTGESTYSHSDGHLTSLLFGNHNMLIRGSLPVHVERRQRWSDSCLGQFFLGYTSRLGEFCNGLLDRNLNLPEAVLVNGNPSPKTLNALRAGGDDAINDVLGLNLANRDLRFANLSGAFLTGADLRGAQLQGASLSRAQLQGANLWRAELRFANLWGARLDGANLRDAQLRGVNLRNGAYLQGADLRDADLQGADLWMGQLQRANLSGASLQRAVLFQAQLNGAQLLQSRLHNANLAAAELQGADLSGAELDGANLMGAYLQGADLSGAYLIGANLQAAQLQGANLEGAQLHRANLAGAQLQGANLQDAQLQGAKLFVAQLQGANLRSARLERANLERAQLEGANLRGASIAGTWLSGAVLTLADLRWLRRVIWRYDLELLYKDFVDIILSSEIREPLMEQLEAVEGVLNNFERVAPLGTILCDEDLVAQPHLSDACVTDIESFNTKLAPFLAALACNDPEGWVARGIAWRAIHNDDRTYAAALAERLLDEQCAGGTALPDDMKSDLRALLPAAAQAP